MSIKRWAIADAITKEITGGILQNDTPPSVASGAITVEVPDMLRDEHPDALQLNSTGDGIELKPDSVILAKKKAEREKEITEELYEEAQKQLPLPVLLRVITTTLGILVKEGQITSSDSGTQALLTLLSDMVPQLGFTPAEMVMIFSLQKSLLDRKNVAKDKIDTIIADDTKSKKEKEEEIKKVKG
jgi:hypothetical protein